MANHGLDLNTRAIMAAAATETLATVDGWPINIRDPGDAIARICSAANAKAGFAVHTLNLDHLVNLRKLDSFREAYRRARYVTADGAPVVWLARKQCSSLALTTGADLVLPLCSAAAREGLSVYLFGATSETLERASATLVAASGNRLELAGAAAPPHGFDPSGTAAGDAIEAIRASGARICFVALGSPKQELFAMRALEMGVPAAFLGVGAALDFLAGSQTRAPQLFRRLGVEWMWRLMTNPRRLGMRYLRCGALMAELMVRGALPRLR